MKNVIAIGNLSYNINIFLNSYPIESQAYSIVKKNKTLGNILDICTLLSKNNINTWYFSIIGDDIEGKEIINNLHKNLINTDYINIINNSKTSKNYVIRNLKTNSKTILYEKNNKKYELIRDLNFNPDIIYIDSNEYTFLKKLKDIYPKIIVISTINSMEEEKLEIARLSDYVIVPIKYAEIITSLKLDLANKKSIMDLYLKMKSIFKNNIIIYSEEFGTLYQSDNKLNIIPNIKEIKQKKYNSFDIYISNIIYGITNDFHIDKTIKIATISKFLYENNKSILNIEEVIKIYEQNN